MKKLIVLLILMTIVSFSGCIKQKEYVCPDGTVVSEPSLCFETTTTMITTGTTVKNANNANISLLDIYCNQNNIYCIIKNEGTVNVNSLTFMMDNVQKNVNCYPILPIKQGQTISCMYLTTIGTHEVKIIGPSNTIVRTVVCKPVDTTIALLDIYCNSTSDIVYTSIKNKGTTIIPFNDIKFYMDGRTIDPNPGCKPPNSLDVGKSVTCNVTASNGLHEIKIVGPSNTVIQNVTCQ